MIVYHKMKLMQKLVNFEQYLTKDYSNLPFQNYRNGFVYFPHKFFSILVDFFSLLLSGT